MHVPRNNETTYTMPPVSTLCTTQVCGFGRRTVGAAFKPCGGQFEARRSVQRKRERDRDVGCIPPRR
jgi:hypothetical protein